MRRFVAGDAEAIRALYARFGPPIYTLGLRMLGSPSSAEELTQDVFLAAWRRGTAFDAARGRLSTWLMAVAHNIAVDRLRHERGPSRPVLVLLERLPEPEPVDGEDAAVIQRDTARRALEDVSPGERLLLTKAYFQGWTAREIAEADGIPLGTVKTRLRAALTKLRKAQAEHARDAARMVGGGE
jgi:RNA polymerase sigma-70 factor (ECF subfamily)